MPKPELRIEDFDYDLPLSNIAYFPIEPRDESKLLLYKNGNIETHIFKDLDEYLPANTQLFINNTKVVPARLLFSTSTGASIEIFYLEPYAQTSILAFARTKNIQIKAYVGNATKWKEPYLTQYIDYQGKNIQIQAKNEGKIDDYYLITLTWNHENLTFLDLLIQLGHMPLPPYIKRKDQTSDLQNYQTVYHQEPGSVAAPTAGLHFSQGVFERLHQKVIQTHALTLHVGAGTFKPVQTTHIREHHMHSEWVEISRDVIEKIKNIETEPIVAVGTTSLRSLESLYWLGVNMSSELDQALFVDQWVYEKNNLMCTRKQSMQNIVSYLDHKQLDKISFQTNIMICPGYDFKMVDALITNFHQPKSTLLLLIAAFIGQDWKKVYNFALANEYRFLSYGDSSLLWKNQVK